LVSAAHSVAVAGPSVNNRKRICRRAGWASARMARGSVTRMGVDACSSARLFMDTECSHLKRLVLAMVNRQG
jgi:hypothetical protein